MIKILAFCGRSYTGKSKSASIVLELDSRFKKISFADPGKEEYSRTNNIPLQDLSTPGVKEGHRPGVITLVEGRKLETGDSGFWAKKLFDTYKEGYFVIDDLRFIEELQELVLLGGVVYKLQANPEVRKARGWIPNSFVDTHYSETEMDLSPHTFYVLTSGGGIFNNETDGDAKLRGQIYKLLNLHFHGIEETIAV